MNTEKIELITETVCGASSTLALRLKSWLDDDWKRNFVIWYYTGLVERLARHIDASPKEMWSAFFLIFAQLFQLPKNTIEDYYQVALSGYDDSSGYAIMEHGDQWMFNALEEQNLLLAINPLKYLLISKDMDGALQMIRANLRYEFDGEYLR